MRFALRIQPDAEEDMKSAFRWYENQKSGLGREFLECVEQAFDRIQENPNLHGAVYRNVRQTLVRRFPYVVCFAIEDELVDVIAVFHGHRDPQIWQSRTR